MSTTTNIPLASTDPVKEYPAVGITTEGKDTAVVQGDEYVPMQPTSGAEVAKQSHMCCGCCCDTRRAVIAVNVISMSFATLAIFTISTISSGKYAEQFDDDEVLGALGEIDGAAVGMTIGFASLGMLCNACGIYGASKFNQWAVLVAGIWYLVEFFRSLVFLDLAGAIMAGFFAYPHAIFWQEMRKGVMSPASYPQEEQCCNCC